MIHDPFGLSVPMSSSKPLDGHGKCPQFAPQDPPWFMFYMRALFLEEMAETKDGLCFIDYVDHQGDYGAYLERLMTHLVIAAEASIPPKYQQSGLIVPLPFHAEGVCELFSCHHPQADEGYEEYIQPLRSYASQSRRCSSAKDLNVPESSRARGRSPCLDSQSEVEQRYICNHADPFVTERLSASSCVCLEAVGEYLERITKHDAEARKWRELPDGREVMAFPKIFTADPLSTKARGTCFKACYSEIEGIVVCHTSLQEIFTAKGVPGKLAVITELALNLGKKGAKKGENRLASILLAIVYEDLFHLVANSKILAETLAKTDELMRFIEIK
ncbi:hypothetical protein Cgig2_013534 [Carnegiea gigantea]|uniref:Uncharacterized protein n=1 Tax=Carnegiea gigantea TaxID=171969 RepID=A0A9Q1JUJ4_9CARY|nr:hypothetical protein Cgig2_013534 [Carnegiea gigantea]